ncbi:hypothetical protein ACHQM5_011616 [Ranunculus cassubicifolius]
MEVFGPVQQASPEELPSLFRYVVFKSTNGFDSIEETGSVNNPSFSTPSPATIKVTGTTDLHVHDQADAYISVSMPSSPSREKKVLFHGDTIQDVNGNYCAITFEKPRQSKFHSQPMAETITDGNGEPIVRQHVTPRIDRLKDKRYNSFKTWSGKLEKQLSHLRGRHEETVPEEDDLPHIVVAPISVDRYFDALEGPELETLRASEELLLPNDKEWPFLLRYPISSFGICLGTSSQAILWKSIATSSSTSFLHVNLCINLILWCISVALVVIVSFTYLLKTIFYFEAIRREYYHPIRANFFFAPFIALLFLALGSPPSIVQNLHPSLWYILMTPILILDLKIYGQWMSGGQRRLSKVANPSNHLAVVGNFVGALLGASMGLKEGPIFFFAVGLAHYTVLFVTLYQRLPTNETLPKDLHPVFFLFVAAPSVASMAWARIEGSFDYGSRISYFIALFLYLSLAVRVNFFRGFKFSLSWWAYTFPMTGAAIATIAYSNEVENRVTQSLSIILSAISTLTVTLLLVCTIIHACVLRDLFPNDIAIAISLRKRKVKKSVRVRSANPDDKSVHDSLKSAGSDDKSVDYSLKSESSEDSSFP